MATSSRKETALRLRAAAEEAVQSIGLGFDLTLDLRLKYCKKHESAKESSSRLIVMDVDQVRDIAMPGGILVQNVPKSINCDKGERMRFSPGVLSFQKMSEQFNQELSISGNKIPAGHFNAAFEFTGRWQKDAAFTKSLAFDGVFITLYSIALEKSQITLCDHVKQAVPSSWDPAALARFIEKFGTHVIVGIKMGGKDVIYVKQQHSSPLQPIDVQRRLKNVANERFSNAIGKFGMQSGIGYGGEKPESNERGLAFLDLSAPSFHSAQEEITFFWRRRGGSSARNIPHDKWCQTVQLEPEVISMSLIPISSLLNGIDGNGFLVHAINLYLRYKPPIEELQQFLEFQLPKQWAPVFGDVPHGPEAKHQGSASLHFSLMGPKLYVNTNEVDVGNNPVTGLRLYLEGKKNNCLAIHLQHLTSLPKTFQILNKSGEVSSSNPSDRRYFEKVQWKSFSHVNTAPVESEDDLSVVTGGQFEVKKNVLSMRLNFSRVSGATVVKAPEWDGSPALAQKSGIISSLISTRFSTGQKPLPNPSDVNMNSALYPEGPPMPAQTRKLLRYVDTTEMTRGPQDSPGYWVVSGARLVVDKGKVSLRVKYSLLTVISTDDEVLLEG